MNRRTLLLLGVLTLSAGYADAVAFFGLGTFTANMTGNTILLGAAIVRTFAPHLAVNVTVGLPALSIGCFAGGAIGAALFFRGEHPRRRALLLGVAAALFVTAALLYRHPPDAAVVQCVALLSAVMGLQSVIAVRSGVPGVSTVYVTGTLVTAIVDAFGSRPAPAVRQLGIANWAAWVLYLSGAIGGSIALVTLGTAALWPPAIAVVLLLPVAW